LLPSVRTLTAFSIDIPEATTVFAAVPAITGEGGFPLSIGGFDEHVEGRVT
jgi:hypothetical protein